MTISIIVSDPEFLVREGIKQILAGDPEFSVAVETADMTETLSALKMHQADICILEVVMGNNAGLQFLRKAKKAAGATSLLVMGYHHEREFSLRVCRAGAAGYLAKDCTAEELIHAVKTIAAHRPYISEIMRDMFIEGIVNARSSRPHDALSDMDFDIFCLLAQSMPIARIASICNLHITAVRARRIRIMQSLSLQNDAEIVQYAIKRKLIDPHT